ncbi:hypothetical protein NPIL_672391, partial [Nephila pilipes]
MDVRLDQQCSYNTQRKCNNASNLLEALFLDGLVKFTPRQLPGLYFTLLPTC